MYSVQLEVTCGSPPRFTQISRYVYDHSLQSDLQAHLQEVVCNVEILISRVYALEKFFKSYLGDTVELIRTRAMGYVIMCSSVISTESFSSELKGVEERLGLSYKKLKSQQPADHAQEREDLFWLLEDLQKIIIEYQVRSSPRRSCSC